jgi:hypothetical protein
MELETTYNQLVEYRSNKECIPLYMFGTLVLLEELTQEELADIEYLDDRMDVWYEVHS